MMIFGYRLYELSGNTDRLIRRLAGSYISYSRLKRKGEKATVRVAAEDCGRFEHLCKRLNIAAVPQKTSRIAALFHTMFSRKGFAVGVLVCIVLGVYLSNRAARFEILCDDSEISSGIMNVLKEEGIGTGTFIPSIDLVKTERALKQRVEGISWAGITRKGNTLIIDVVETQGSTERRSENYPSNLVACEDGVIESIEIQNGQVRIPAGSGVTRGDIIVSGEIITKTSKWIDAKEHIDTKITYARSRGKVLGTFTRRLTFTQEQSAQTLMLSPDTQTKRYFTFFDVQLPLFVTAPEGTYKTEESDSVIKLFGLDLPLGIKTVTVTPYKYGTKELSSKQALKLAHEKEENYRKNLLGKYELKNVKLSESNANGKAVVTAEYTLYGELCREVSFFVPKSEMRKTYRSYTSADDPRAS